MGSPTAAAPAPATPAAPAAPAAAAVTVAAAPYNCNHQCQQAAYQYHNHYNDNVPHSYFNISNWKRLQNRRKMAVKLSKTSDMVKMANQLSHDTLVIMATCSTAKLARRLQLHTTSPLCNWPFFVQPSLDQAPRPSAHQSESTDAHKYYYTCT